jgi:hypothetical protein
VQLKFGQIETSQEAKGDRELLPDQSVHILVVVIVKDWSAGERRHTKLAKGVSLDSQEMLEGMGESLIELALSRVASEHDPPRPFGGVETKSPPGAKPHALGGGSDLPPYTRER